MEPVSHQPVDDSLAVFRTLMKFHTEGRFCDVTVQVGDESFHCHRSLLAAMSEFFETMFQSDFKEGRSDIDEPVVLHGVHPLAFEAILNLMHTNHLTIDDENVHLLLRANNFLRLRTTFIEERCFLFLSQEVVSGQPLSHALDVLSFAFLLKKLRFIDLMCDHIIKYVHQFAKDDRFMELPFDVLDTILFKFTESARAIDEERGNTLLNVILCWVNHSRATRYQYRNALMRNINSSCISTDYALFLLNKHENRIDKAAEDSGDGKAECFADLYNSGGVPGVDPHIPFATGTACRFRIQNFKGPWREKVSPQRYRIRDLLWSMIVKRSKTSEYLSFSVNFDGERDTCRARVSFMIQSQKDELKDFVRDTTGYTYVARTDIGVQNFIKWVDIIDEKKGYLKDNCVIFKVYISF